MAPYVSVPALPLFIALLCTVCPFLTHTWLPFPLVCRRFATLFLIGLALNIWGSNFRAHFRIMGVLQRIALCYLLSTLLFVLVRSAWVQRVVVFGGMGGLYLGVMYGVDVPGEGCGKGQITPECNACNQ